MMRNKPFSRRLLAALLAALMLSGLMAATALAVSEDFTDIKKAPGNAYYTRLRLNGYDGTVYAFNDTEGQTQFRVYGTLARKRGYYPVSVTLNETAEDQDEQTFSVELLDTTPVKDGARKMGSAKLVDGRAEVPENWKRARAKELVYIENLFGVKEYRGYASFDGETYYYFPTANSRPKAGSLASVVEDMTWRARQPGQRALRVPSELRRGFQTWVYITTTDGHVVMVPTDYPALDVDALRLNIRPSQPAKTTAGKGSTVMGRGSYGQAVTRLQNRLNELGYNTGTVDSQFGAQTEAALKAFQAANGLPQTGKADNATLEKLYAQAAAPAQTAAPTDEYKGPVYIFKDHVQMTLTANKTTLNAGETLTLTGSFVADDTVAANTDHLDSAVLLLRDGKVITHKDGNPATLEVPNMASGTYTAMFHVAGGEHMNLYKELTIVVGDGKNPPATPLSDLVEIILNVSRRNMFVGESLEVEGGAMLKADKKAVTEGTGLLEMKKQDGTVVDSRPGLSSWKDYTMNDPGTYTITYTYSLNGQKISKSAEVLVQAIPQTGPGAPGYSMRDYLKITLNVNGTSFKVGDTVTASASVWMTDDASMLPVGTAFDEFIIARSQPSFTLYAEASSLPATISHTFTEPGEYYVQAMYSAEGGPFTVAETVKVQVTAPEAPAEEAPAEQPPADEPPADEPVTTP